MDFRPARPPQSPEYPGSLYLVNSFGDLKSLVCKSDVWKSELPPRTAGSRTIYASAHTSGTIKSGGDESDTGSTVSVSISFKDSKIFQHDEASLNTIATQLQNQESCKIALEKTIEQGRCVVQSQAILVSTVEFIANSEGKVLVGTAKDKLLQKLLLSGGLLGFKHFVGQKLQYGLRLRDRCMVVDKNKYRRLVPDERWWLFKSSWNFILSLWERII